MNRYILLHERTRPYRITRERLGWVIWDRRDFLGTIMVGRIMGLGWPSGAGAHPTHAAAISALDAHLREQIVTELSE